MPDLLAHVLFAYAVVTAVGWRIDPMTPPLVTLAMVGATLPDLSKVHLVFDDDALEAVVGGPIEWLALHTGGGIALSVAIASVLVAARYRRRATLAVATGALSHVVLDLFLDTATGVAPYAVFWPVTTYRPPTPGLYLSTQPWPTLLAGVLAVVVWGVDRHRSGDGSDR